MAVDQRDYMIGRERKRFYGWLGIDKKQTDGSTGTKQSFEEWRVEQAQRPKADAESSPWWMAVLAWLVVAVAVFAGLKRFL